MERTTGVLKMIDKNKAIRMFYENRITDVDGAKALGISVHSYQSRRNEMGLKTLLWGKSCCECKVVFVSKLKFQIRCHECCELNKMLFVTKKSILYNIRQLAEVDLEGAKRFVFEMERDDPKMLDGIRDLLPENVRCKNG